MTMDFDSGSGTAAQADADTGSSEEADVQAILAFEQALYGAQIAGDFEAWMASFAEDVVLFPPNASPLNGLAAIRRFNAPIFEQFDLHESSDEREVVVARLWGELSFREIGEITGTSESTAHRRYQGALARLREKVSPSWAHPNEKTN